MEGTDFQGKENVRGPGPEALPRTGITGKETKSSGRDRLFVKSNAENQQ